MQAHTGSDRTNGALLLFEGVDMTPGTCDHMFEQLKQMGVFERGVGAVIGYVNILEQKSGEVQMEDVLERITAGGSLRRCGNRDGGVTSLP